MIDTYCRFVFAHPIALWPILPVIGVITYFVKTQDFDEPIVTPCGHYFHSEAKDCLGTGSSIRSWMQKHKCCPICKQEIIAECASRCMCERVDRLRIAVRQPGMSAIEQLKTYVLTDLQISHEMAENDKRISELVNNITLERPDLVYKKIEAEYTLIAEIISHGNETGEFNIDDIITTAQTIHSSLIIFNVPIFMTLYSQEQFEEKAIAIVELIVHGLSKRN